MLWLCPSWNQENERQKRVLINAFVSRLKPYCDVDNQEDKENLYNLVDSVATCFQWSHDNLSGLGDTFSFNSEYSKVIKRGTLLYGIPNFLSRNQDLLHSIEARREDAPGFTILSATT